MEIGESHLGNHLVLRPVGRLDNGTSADFQAYLVKALNAAGRDIIVDFSGINYVSSAGLRALMAASRLKPAGRRIAVAAAGQVVQEILTISRFHEVIPLFATVDAANEAWTDKTKPVATRSATPPHPPTVPVHFWGTRGSLAAPLNHNNTRGKIREALMAARDRQLRTPEAIDAFIERDLAFSVRGTFGGNTACVEIGTGGNEYMICDLGTGVREFGAKMMMQHGPARPQTYNVFLSHVHWDHIMGFPFFTPAYIPGNKIRIYSAHRSAREALLRQQSAPCFPVLFESLGATIEFIELETGQNYEIAGFTVSCIRQFHEGESYGYRFTKNGKVIVYSTDCEHKASVLDNSYPFVSFFRHADLLIFDAMYSLADAVSVKEDWGHSSNIIAVELAQLARVKKLAMFHHEPAYDDARIERVLGETIRYEEISREDHKVEVISAYDGLDLSV
ncbi:MAG: STAS domain-containing protein [Alphaproteobacteria bacterium]|nr:STAS domain-containing protein [Alphaproteobacteria bacterium]